MTTSAKHIKYGNYNITLNTGNEIIEPQDVEILLGGQISSNLKWFNHIMVGKKSMLTVLTSRINALSKIAAVASFKDRKMIANGIVLSKLIYLIQLWGGTSNFLIKILQKLQNKAARIVTKMDKYTPIKTLLLQCGWLSIKQLVQYHSLLQIYKTKKNQRPGFLHERLSMNCRYKTRLIATQGIKTDNSIKSDLAKQNFTYFAIKTWNDLPPHIRQSNNLNPFKKDVKSWVRNNISIE